MARGPCHPMQLKGKSTHGPHAGGSEHYAAYLINSDGFELELVATTYAIVADASGKGSLTGRVSAIALGLAKSLLKRHSPISIPLIRVPGARFIVARRSSPISDQ